MNYEQAKKILTESDQKDWIVDDETGSFTYKKDLNLHIQRADFESYRPFNEPWATNHPDPSALAIEYTVKYGESYVDKYTLVSVDGHRAELPMPKAINNPVVRKDDVNFAKIVSTGGDRVDEYLKRSKLEVKNEEG